MPRGIAKGEQVRGNRGPLHTLSRPFAPILRLAGLCLVATSLSACAVGSMGAMMGGGADGVASVSQDGADQANAVVETPEHQEFVAMAEVIETPVWAALSPLERDRGGLFNMGSVVGMLLTGNETEVDTEEPTPESDAARYVDSLDSLFSDRNEVAIAMAVDIFRKNSKSRRFISAARAVVGTHERPISAVNAAFQAGDMDAAAYRSELNKLDADRRVLSRVMSSIMEQRRTFSRARAILVADDPQINLARVDEELASLAQYQEMIARLSARLSGDETPAS